MKLEVGVHLDGLPATHAVLVHATQQIGVVGVVPGTVEVRRFHVEIQLESRSSESVFLNWPLSRPKKRQLNMVRILYTSLILI